jgi:hypothetical protein
MRSGLGDTKEFDSSLIQAGQIASMPKVDRYVGWWLSDGLQMLAFEAELAHLPRSLISALGVRVSLRVRQFTFSSTSPSQVPDRILRHSFP